MQFLKPRGEVTSIVEKLRCFFFYAGEVRLVVCSDTLLLQPFGNLSQLHAIGFRTRGEQPPELRMLSFAGQSGETIRYGAREREMVNVIVSAADGAPQRSFIRSFCQFFSEREIFRPIERRHDFSHQFIGEDEVAIRLGRIGEPPLIIESCERGADIAQFSWP